MPTVVSAPRLRQRRPSTIESLTGWQIQGVHIVGGGSRNNYLNQATANATGLPVLAGPAEAVAELIAQCRRGPSAARVDAVQDEDASSDALNVRCAGERFSVLGTI